MAASGIRKAAILLASLPHEEAAAVLAKLTREEVDAVSLAIVQLGHLPGEEQEAVIHEFAEANSGLHGGTSGGLDLAKTLVEKALGKNAEDTIDKLQQSVEALPFGFLRKVDPQNLLTFIIDEHPQTIALILSHLPPSYGAEIIAGLPAARQLPVIRHMAHMGQTNPEVIREVENGLASRMSSVTSHSFEHAGGLADVARILNVTDRATERALMESLAQEEPGLVDEIRRLMFVFEDITKLSDKDVQSVLKNVESSQWSTALKGASEELREKVLGNMSKRAGQNLREEMEYLGPVRVSEVEAVQQQIVDVIRRLEDAGELSIHTGDDGDQFIE